MVHDATLCGAGEVGKNGASATRGARAVKAPGARRADARAIGLGLCDRTAKASAAHTRLRAQQVSKPLRTAAPRWPAELSPALKRTFKRDKAAVRLLVRFGYANDSNW